MGIDVGLSQWLLRLLPTRSPIREPRIPNRIPSRIPASPQAWMPAEAARAEGRKMWWVLRGWQIRSG